MPKTSKRVYQLWWEYLTLSDNYIRLCNLLRKYGEYTVNEVLELEKKEREIEGGITKDSLLIDIDKGIVVGSIKDTYQTFGDVHASSFEYFWESKGEQLCELEHKNITDEPIIDLKLLFEDMVKVFDSNQYKEDALLQNFSDFKQYISFLVRSPLHRFLMIDLTKPISEIKREFNKFVNKQQKKKLRHDIVNPLWLECRNRKPTPNLKIKEVKRYFKVLKVFKVDGLRGKAAFQKVFPEDDYDDPDQRSVFYSDLRKAKRIVKNVEIGFFPGIYEKTALKIFYV